MSDKKQNCGFKCLSQSEASDLLARMPELEKQLRAVYLKCDQCHLIHDSDVCKETRKYNICEKYQE